MKISLTTKDLTRLGQKMQLTREEIRQVNLEFLHEMGRLAVETAKLYSGSTGELANGFKYTVFGNTVVQLINDCPYAPFVEYGTGVMGMGTHPEVPSDWAYDVNNHGYKGWVYRDKNGNFRWTAGQVGVAFMYYTKLDLLNKKNEVYSYVARRYITPW